MTSPNFQDRLLCVLRGGSAVLEKTGQSDSTFHMKAAGCDSPEALVLILTFRSLWLPLDQK